MTNRLLRGLCLLLLLAESAVFPAAAHSGKARFHLLVDTDGGADDLRTLCLLLGSRDAEVLAVVSSDGALPPAATACRVAALLHTFHHEGIPVGEGRPTAAEVPWWRAHSLQVDWGDTTQCCGPFPPAAAVLAEALAGESEPVTGIALGPLTNWSDLVREHPELLPRLERILWYDDRADRPEGANGRADRAAVRHLLGCGIPVEIVAAAPATALPVEPLLDTLDRLPTPYARKIVATHRSAPLEALCRSHHLSLWDDLVAVRLFAPELFAETPLSASVRCCTPQSARAVGEAVAAILRGRPDAECRVFAAFPIDTACYAADVAALAAEAIRRHGPSEWRAAVLTNELHGHLGIYATVGVKMGLRAREYFAIGIDDVAVTSFAGSRPPVSCLNDGLQVATGGTAGHGLLTVAGGDAPRPEALFRFKNRAVRLRLKPEYAARIRADVQCGVAQYGPDSEAYWQYIRALALQYWLEFDRHAIFELTAEP